MFCQKPFPGAPKNGEISENKMLGEPPNCHCFLEHRAQVKVNSVKIRCSQKKIKNEKRPYDLYVFVCFLLLFGEFEEALLEKW